MHDVYIPGNKQISNLLRLKKLIETLREADTFDKGNTSKSFLVTKLTEFVLGNCSNLCKGMIEIHSWPSNVTCG